MPLHRHSVPAFLWDGTQCLPGTLALSEEVVEFEVGVFPDAHLNLRVPYTQIRKTELLLIFDLALHGLLIQDSEGRRFCFVLDEPAVFRKDLRKRIEEP